MYTKSVIRRKTQEHYNQVKLLNRALMSIFLLANLLSITIFCMEESEKQNKYWITLTNEDNKEKLLLEHEIYIMGKYEPEVNEPILKLIDPKNGVAIKATHKEICFENSTDKLAKNGLDIGKKLQDFLGEICGHTEGGFSSTGFNINTQKKNSKKFIDNFYTVSINKSKNTQRIHKFTDEQWQALDNIIKKYNE